MRGEAAKTVTACRDLRTVQKALGSRYRSLRVWAVLSFESRVGYTDTRRHGGRWFQNSWRNSRIPTPESVCIPFDRLWSYADGVQAIAKHAPQEMDPEVLLRIARTGSSPSTVPSCAFYPAQTPRSANRPCFSSILIFRTSIPLRCDDANLSFRLLHDRIFQLSLEKEIISRRLPSTANGCVRRPSSATP